MIKEINLYESLQNVNFLDQKFEMEFKPVKLQLDLIVNEKVVASQEKEISQLELFPRNKNSTSEADMTNLYILIIVLVSIIIISLIVWKINNKKIVSIMILTIGLFSSAFVNFVIKQDTVSASPDARTTLGWHNAHNPSGNQGFCPVTVYPSTTVKASCSTCLNGKRIRRYCRQ